MAGFTTPAWAIGADSHSAAIVRMAQQGMLAGTGVVGSALKVVHVASELKVKVEPGSLYMPGTLGTHANSRVNSGNQHASYSSLTEYFTTQGTYHSYLPEAENLSVSTPSASHERIDLVVAYVEDAEWSGALNQAVLAIVTGEPAAEPVAPAPPASSVVLAQYKVPVGATEVLEANITDKRPYAAPELSSASPALQATSSSAFGALTTRTSGTEYEPSATRPTFVALTVEGGSETTAIGMEVSVGGVLIANPRIGTITEHLESHPTFSFLCPPAVKWKAAVVHVGSGTPTLKSSYLTL